MEKTGQMPGFFINYLVAAAFFFFGLFFLEPFLALASICRPSARVIDVSLAKWAKGAAAAPKLVTANATAASRDTAVFTSDPPWWLITADADKMLQPAHQTE